MIHPAPLPSPDLLELHARLDRLEKMLEKALSSIPAGQDMLSTDQAAVFLGLSKSTVWKLSCARILPYHKSGKLNRYKLADLTAYLEGRRRPSREEIEARGIAQAMRILDGGR